MYEIITNHNNVNDRLLLCAFQSKINCGIKRLRIHNVRNLEVL